MSDTRTNPLARDLDEVLAAMGDLWDELRGARLFITGGTGFFGCWLLETLLWANQRLQLGASAVVLTRDPQAFGRKVPHLAGDPAVTLCTGDVRDFAFPEGNFSHVIHAATSSSTPVRPDEMFDTIVSGTERSLALSQASGAQRFLLISSGAVYGRQPDRLTHIPESYEGAPDSTNFENVYAEGKRAAEMLCAIHATPAISPVIARCFSILGPGLAFGAHFAAGNFIRDALAGGPIRLLDPATIVRSYLYPSDLIIWLWTILLKGVTLRPYNVGSEHAVTLSVLAETIASLVEPRPVIACGTVDNRGAGALTRRYVPSTMRARTELLLNQAVDLHTAISRTITWHRSVTATTGTSPAHG